MLARVPLLVVAALAASPVPSFAVTIATRDEDTGTAVLEAYAKPFTAATEIPVHWTAWDGTLDSLRTRDPGTGPDIVRIDAETLAAGCAEGLFEKLDWSAIGGKDHYLSMGVTECGAGAAVETTVLAWDRDKFPSTPTWADFWDVAKIPGKRGLGKLVRGAVEIALLADGVAPGDVYKTLATPEGVDRAFRKLDQLKPYIVWWQTQAEAVKILGSGDVLMAAAPGSAILRANQSESRNFGIQFSPGLYEPRYWAIMKGTPALREAQQFLYVTGAPSIEARLFRVAGEPGLAKGANDWLTPDQQALSPTVPANAGAALRVDTAFWHDNLAKLQARFESWMAQ